MYSHNSLALTLTLLCAFKLGLGNHVEAEVDEEESTSSKFILIGTDSSFETFSGFPSDSSCDSLTAIEFEYVEFDPQVLTGALDGCDDLETLHLHNVEWMGNFTSRVSLPNLRDFILFRSRGSSLDLDKETLKSLIFFDKGRDWRIEEVAQLGTNITTQHFRFNVMSGRIQSSLDFSNEILQNSGARSLSLEETEVSMDLFPPTLETLILRRVRIPGRVMLDEIFRKTPKLRELELDHTEPNVVEMSHLPLDTLETLVLANVEIVQAQPVIFKKLTNLTVRSALVHPIFVPESITDLELDDSFVHEGNFNGIFERANRLETLILRRPTPSYLDISYLPGSISELELENMNLFISKPATTLVNLTSFSCRDCNFDLDIVRSFHVIFKNVRVFDIWIRNLNLPFYELLTKMIHQTASRRIEITDLERLAGSGGNQGRGLAGDSSEVEDFLHAAGVPDRSMNFVIEKNGTWSYVEPWEAHPTSGTELELDVQDRRK